MKYKKDFDTLVIVGNWNYSIFNPDWVAKYLLDGEKNLKVSIPLNAGASPQIEGKNVKIYVIGNKLGYQGMIHTDENYEIIQRIALKTADYLPHTPVIAFGINFVFEQEIAENMEIDLMAVEDRLNLEEHQFQLKSTALTRTYQTDTYRLNLTVNQIDKLFQFNFNYHVDISNLVEFKTRIDEQGIIDYKNKALNLMAELYNLKLDE